MGQHLDIGRNVFHGSHRQDLSKSLNIHQRCLGPSKITKFITNTRYQIQDDNDPTSTKTVHRTI